MPKPKPAIRHAEIVSRFAARLRELRNSRGMTQAELARQASVTPAYIWRLESGAAAPGIDLVARLAAAIGVPIQELLPQGVSPDSVAILRERAQKLFDSLLETADRESLMMLNPLLARLLAASSKHR